MSSKVPEFFHNILWQAFQPLYISLYIIVSGAVAKELRPLLLVYEVYSVLIKNIFATQFEILNFQQTALKAFSYNHTVQRTHKNHDLSFTVGL